MSSRQKWAIALSMRAPAMASVPLPEPGTFGSMTFGVVALVAATVRKRKYPRRIAKESPAMRRPVSLFRPAHVDDVGTSNEVLADDG